MSEMQDSMRNSVVIRLLGDSQTYLLSQMSLLMQTLYD